MKIILTLFFLLVAINANTQSALEDQSKWKIGINFSPDLYIEAPFIKRGSTTSASFSYTIGVAALVRTGENVEFGTGINFSQKNVRNNENPYTFDPITLPAEFYNNKTRMNFIEFPSYYRYTFKKEKFNLHFDAGFNIGFLLSKSGDDYLFHNLEKETLIHGLLGIGSSFNLNRNLNFTFTSLYRYPLMFLYTDDIIELRSISLMTSFNYKL